MAKDDMHVVIFKILAYIYDCMKSGKTVDKDVIGYESLEIPEPYWIQIMSELQSRGYVTGISVKATTTRTFVCTSDPKVTLDGVEFLMENSMMSKAARLVADTGDFFSKVVFPFI